MTRPKDPKQMVRLNRRLGDVLRTVLCCPLCSRDRPWAETLRVVAYRTRTVRLRCDECGLRFSVDMDDAVQRIEAAAGTVPHVALVVWNRQEMHRDIERERKAEERHRDDAPSGPVVRWADIEAEVRGDVRP